MSRQSLQWGLSRKQNQENASFILVGLGPEHAINGNLVRFCCISSHSLCYFLFGIFSRKPVYLEAYDETVIRHLVVDTEQTGTYWKVNVDVYFENNIRNNVIGTLQLSTKVSTVITHTINIKPNVYGETVYSTSFLVLDVSNILSRIIPRINYNFG